MARGVSFFSLANRARRTETKCIDYSRRDFDEPADLSLIAGEVFVLAAVSIDTRGKVQGTRTRDAACV